MARGKINEKDIILCNERRKNVFCPCALKCTGTARGRSRDKNHIRGYVGKVASVLAKAADPLYQKALDNNIIVGVCRVCSNMMGVLEENEKLGLELLADMKGHAGMKNYIENGYEVIMS